MCPYSVVTGFLKVPYIEQKRNFQPITGSTSRTNRVGSTSETIFREFQNPEWCGRWVRLKNIDTVLRFTKWVPAARNQSSVSHHLPPSPEAIQDKILQYGGLAECRPMPCLKPWQSLLPSSAHGRIGIQKKQFSPRKKWFIFISLQCGTFIIVTSFSILNYLYNTLAYF